MNVRALLIDDVAKARVREVLAHAEAHPYRPGPGQTLPGDDDRHVADLGTFRAVFSYTHADGIVFRHLSVSVPGGKYPNLAAAFAIAEMFGFTGWRLDDLTSAVPEPPTDWVLGPGSGGTSVVIAQPIGAQEGVTKQ